MPEPYIGAGSLGTTPVGQGRTSRPTTTTTFGGKVSWDGLKGMASSFKEMASYSTTLVKNLADMNRLGRMAASVFQMIAGGGRGPAGAPSMTPHLDHLTRGAGTPGAGTRGAGPSMAWFTQYQQKIATPGTAPPVAPGTTIGTPAAPAAQPAGYMGWMGAVQARAATAAAAAAPAGGGPPAGVAPAAAAAAGGGGSMPWLQRLSGIAQVGVFGAAAAAPFAANMLSNRFGRNVAESAPISAQSTLMASMYGGVRYNQIEMDRFRALGQFGGTRQEAAATQQMALRYGQTPQQANMFMQGVGTTVQALGGTATASQVTQAAGGFLDPMVLRRQQAMGMQMARVGGQVRPPMEVAQDYIKLYETRFMRNGQKMNEFDFINLQTPGSPLRMMFQRFFGLDDQTIDMFIVPAGLQQVKAGGQINYASSAALTAAGLGPDKLGLRAMSYQTTVGRREARFGQNQEGSMVNRIASEERLQEVMSDLEQTTGDLLGRFHELERVLQPIIIGLGAMGAMNLMGGMRGGGGGGGGLLGMLGMGRGIAPAVGAPGVAAAAAPGAGAVAGPSVGAGIAPTAIAVGAGAAPTLGRAARFAASPMGPMAGMAGAGIAIGGLQTAVNARNWGDIFSATAQGAVGGAGIGAAFGNPLAGAVVGGISTAIVAGVETLLAGRTGEKLTAGRESLNMTDNEIIQRIIEGGRAEEEMRNEAAGGGQQSDILGNVTQIGPLATGFSPDEWREVRADDPKIAGLIDTYQRRRSTLIHRFMTAAMQDHQAALDDLYKLSDEKVGHPWAAAKWGETASDFANISASAEPSDTGFTDAGEDLIELTTWLRQRSQRNKFDDPEHWDELNALYKEYFGEVQHPMLFTLINTPAANDILNEYSYTSAEEADVRYQENLNPEAGGQRGDPQDTNTQTTDMSTQYAFVNNMPMAPEPTGDETWTHMHPIMKKRLRALFAGSKGKVHWNKGGGWRSYEDQKAMFLDRYRVGPGRDQVEWNGQVWHHIKLAVAAPPGRSMHEIGLAADLGGDMGWLGAHGKDYGLRDFSDVNDEPWHVQPAELPGSRRDYEAEGWADVWGTQVAGSDTATASTGEGGGGGSGATFGGSSGIGGSSKSALGLSTSSLSTLGGAGASIALGVGGGASQTTTSAASSDTSDIPTDGTPLTFEQVAKLAYNVGFRKDELQTMIAIARAESGLDPDVQGDVSIQDNKWGPSIGLWQIRSLKAQRGTGAERDIEQLVKPEFNAASAWTISSQGSNFEPWSVYNRTSHLQYMDEALAAMQSQNLGDAEFDRGNALSIITSMHTGDAEFDTGVGASMSLAPSGGISARGGGVGVSGGRAPINVNVTIKSTGNYAYDARQLARAVRPAFEAEYAEVSAKRSA